MPRSAPDAPGRASVPRSTHTPPDAGRGSDADSETRRARLAPRERFYRLADRATAALGSVQAMVASVLLVAVWAATGPVFHFSDTWQLFINTTTTVITFAMVFVIQTSANRQAKATQLKLDEIIRAIGDARNEFIALDRATDQVLEQHEEEFEALSDAAAKAERAARQPPRAARAPRHAPRRRVPR